MKNCMIAVATSLISMNAFANVGDCQRAIPPQESIVTGVNPYATGHVLPIEQFLSSQVNDVHVGDRITHLRVWVAGAYDAPAQLFVNQKPVEQAVQGVYDAQSDSTVFCLTIRPKVYFGPELKSMRWAFQGEAAPQFLELQIHKVGSVIVKPTPVPNPPRPRPRVQRHDIICKSSRYKPQVCLLLGKYVPNSLRIIEHFSDSPCVKGQSYWIDRDRLIVTEGCRAKFSYNYYEAR